MVEGALEDFAGADFGEELRTAGCELRVEAEMDLVARLDDLAVGISRVTSVGGLSSRRPRKAAWRTRLSAVQVAKRTWQTSLGSTQWTSRRASAGRRVKGMVLVSSLWSLV